jgi:hypothetical protein
MSKMVLKFDHLGVACADLESSTNLYEGLGYHKVSQIYVDNQIGVRCLFLDMESAPRIELCEALPGINLLNPWLSSGSPIYHIAFKVTQDWKNFSPSPGEHLVFGPVPAVAFEGKNVWFTLRKNRQLVEYIYDGE